MTSDATTNRYIPYVGAPGWLAQLRTLFQRSVPAKVDVEWLMGSDRFKFSQANARNLVSTLAKMGWIGSDGTVLNGGKKLRLVGETYENAMRDEVDRFYADLVAQIRDAEQFSTKDLDQFFVATSNVGQSGRGQMIGVFRWFVREAGLKDIEQKIWGQTRSATRSNAERRERVNARPTSHSTGRRATPPKAAETPAPAGALQAPQQEGDPRLATISTVLRINIDGQWDEPRMKAAFRWFDMLLKGESINA